MPAPTKAEWSKVHAEAWRDPEFRTLLEQNPAAALAFYNGKHGTKFDQVIDIGPKPDGVDDDQLHTHHKAPPACC